MHGEPLPISEHHRVVAGLPFVEALARRLAASMPHSIDIGDLVQDGVLGLMDAANRFDAARGIKFETFAERRVRGAMIDALRREAWPRGVRRVRRELEAAREALRLELGCEPSVADLAARVGSDEKRLNRTIVRIHTIESTSPLSAGDHVNESGLPAVLVPSEPDSPDVAYVKSEARERVRHAIGSLPPRERRLINLYYFGDVTMKQIGAELGVNESRVSQLHARAIQRLRKTLAPDMAPARQDRPSKQAAAPAPRPATVRPDLAAALRSVLVAFHQKPAAARASLPSEETARVLPYSITSRATRSKSPSRNGFASHRHPVSSRNRSASVPATSPVTKITRRASNGLAAAMVR
jgi:RNA polymerase sigma factor for flagellar operon FliA